MTERQHKRVRTFSGAWAHRSPNAPRPRGEKLLEMAVTKLGFSARAYDRVLKVARTIADLAGETDIGTPHISEAIQYRMMDRMR